MASLSSRCLVADCPDTFDAFPLLAAHLVDAHLWNGSTAYLRARTAFLKEEAAASVVGAAAAGHPAPEPFDLAAHRRAEKPPRPHAPKNTDQPSAPKEAPMPGAKPKSTPMADRTCGACNKKGHRSDHCPEGKPASGGNGKPAPAKAAPTCGYCHRPAGSHSKGCKKGPCKICAKVAPKKCGFHSGEGGKQGPKGARSAEPARPNFVVVSDLTKIKAAIAEHESTAAALRKALEILEK